MLTRDYNHIFPEYVCAARAHGEATMTGNHKEANKQYAKLTRIYKQLERDLTLAETLLAGLLQHSNASVRVWAAAHALGLKIMVNEAVKVLEKASANNDIGILRLDAEMTLKAWKKRGEIKF